VSRFENLLGGLFLGISSNYVVSSYFMVTRVPEYAQKPLDFEQNPVPTFPDKGHPVGILFGEVPKNLEEKPQFGSSNFLIWKSGRKEDTFELPPERVGECMPGGCQLSQGFGDIAHILTYLPL